jgi:hypothetical protein
MNTRRALLGIVLVLAAAACCPAAGTGAQGAGAAAGVGPGDWRTDTAPPARAMLEVARKLAELQFVPTGQEGRSFIVKGGTLSIPLQTEAGRCYVFTSTSSRDLVDIDSYLFQASGAEVD